MADRFFVYIIKSLRDGTYYKGFTTDYDQRLLAHNSGESHFTAGKVPWELIYVEEHPTKSAALIRERKPKRCKAEYFEWLIGQPSNLLGR